MPRRPTTTSGADDASQPLLVSSGPSSRLFRVPVAFFAL